MKSMLKIVIVGGGTAGWMAAAYFAKHRGGENITLIESDKIPIIGVGESVTPHVAHFFNELGIKDHDWMKKTGAVYKYANKFVNWRHNKGEYEYFSFNYTVPGNNFYKDITANRSYMDFSDDVSNARSIDYLAQHCSDSIFNKRFDQYFNPQFHYMEKNVAPFYKDEHLLNQPFSYSHHINAEMASNYIRDEIAKPAGVTHIIDTVTEVKSFNDIISSITLSSGRVITGHVFIDCSGFHKALVSKLGWKDRPYDYHAIDSAYVCQNNYVDQTNEMVNYTQSIAEPYGWRFKIGLYHRMGNGYCYSSTHLSDDAAKQHLEKVVKDRKREPRLIKWRPARLEKFANGNVAAIGLSCGFIEPLEANSLYIITNSIRRLHAAMEGDRLNFSSYNARMTYTIDDIADFILVHYTLSQRQDTEFWKDMSALGRDLKHKELVFEKINHKFNTMKSSISGYTLFPDYMWMQLAISWGLEVPKRNLDVATIQLSLEHFNYFEKKHKMISNLCEPNYEWHKKNIFKMDPQEWAMQELGFHDGDINVV